MNNLSLMDREKRFEEAHCTCKELMGDSIDRIERFSSKWLVIAIAGLFLYQLASSIYFHHEMVSIKTKIDHRYFLTKENLESIHEIRLENGKITGNFKN